MQLIHKTDWYNKNVFLNNIISNILIKFTGFAPSSRL